MSSVATRITINLLLISRIFVYGFSPLGQGSWRTMTFPSYFKHCSYSGALNMSTTDIDEIKSMRIGELKKELESMGISTKTFLEKKELVDALVKAREEGLQPKTTNQGSEKPHAENSAANNGNDSLTRDEKIATELVKCNAMKASELKAELNDLGINTKTFFEKSEFAKALAEARIDGVKKKSEEGYAEYTEVEVLPADGPGPKSVSNQSNQQSNQQTASPFGDIGNMFGGMGGGMNMEDLMKNMGGGGGGMPNIGDMFGGGGNGNNPFGGGGNPFGGGMPDMGKVQAMMSNPKVREIMSQAQSNPRVMAALTECMSNPAAIAKYQKDPEIVALVNELQKYI